jgi:hypothetical protein
VVDLDSGLVLAAPVYAADQPDRAALADSLLLARVHLACAGSETEIEEATADKGYHKAQTLAAGATVNVRTYIPEGQRPQRRVWTDQPPEWERAYRANRRRRRGARGRRLQRRRGEYVERTFAHVCETGGARRSWLRRLEEVGKRYVVQAAAHNLGGIMRRPCGRGTPRSLPGAAAAVGAWSAWLRAVSRPSPASA